MRTILNKYKILWILYFPFFVFVLIIGLVKTNKSVTTTGNITNISSFVKIDGGYESEGSFNSVYVISVDHSTIFQNICASIDPNAEVDEMGINYSQYSTSELSQMGIIQKNQSLEASIIDAYTYASETNENIKIDYSFTGLIVSSLIVSAEQQFKIGDIITSINDVSTFDYYKFRSAYVSMYEGSIVKILRNGIEQTLTLNSSSANYNDGNAIKGKVGVYDKYNIKSLTPALSLGKISTSGPSAGLMQTLGIYNMLTSTDITLGRRICGTGTIDTDYNVGKIGGIREKVVAAYKNKCKVFLCPEDNYDEALIQYEKLGKNRSRMKLISVKTFSDALEALL